MNGSLESKPSSVNTSLCGRPQIDFCNLPFATLRDPSVLMQNLRHGEINTASRNLEGTYIIRLFAEFETGIRQYWDVTWGTIVRTSDLLEGLAARRLIPHTDLANGHRVREFRNGLVHEREHRSEPLELSVARKYLCTFFSYLPVQW